jgi:hypothetical protein
MSSTRQRDFERGASALDRVWRTSGHDLAFEWKGRSYLFYGDGDGAIEGLGVWLDGRDEDAGGFEIGPPPAGTTEQIIKEWLSRVDATEFDPNDEDEQAMGRNPDLPRAPEKRRFGQPPPAPRRRQATLERLRKMGEAHEREERPFDPEKRGDWRGSAHELVVNPSGFKADLTELVARYHGHLRGSDSVEDIVSEIMRAVKEEDADDAMRVADEKLGGHGIEALGPVNMRDGPPYLYVNFGDTYSPTLVWERDGNKFFVAMGGWGTVWEEEGEANLFDEEWQNWLERDFEKKVARDLDIEVDNDNLTEARRDELVERAEADSRQLFDVAMREAQEDDSPFYPEIVEQSDGIYIQHFRRVVDAAVKLLIAGWEPKRHTRNSAAITVRKATERLGSPYEVTTPVGVLYRETLAQAMSTARAQGKAHGLPVVKL